MPVMIAYDNQQVNDCWLSVGYSKYFKVNKEEMTVTVYAVTDQRLDYISIVSG